MSIVKQATNWKFREAGLRHGVREESTGNVSVTGDSVTPALAPSETSSSSAATGQAVGKQWTRFFLHIPQPLHMKPQYPLLILMAAAASLLVAQDPSSADPQSAPVPATKSTSAPAGATPAGTLPSGTPSLEVPAALPAGYELLEALNDLCIYKAGSPEPLHRALDWFQQIALAKASAAANAQGVSPLRQPNHAAAVWSGILFRAAADGEADAKSIEARLAKLKVVLPNDTTPILREALKAAARAASEKRTVDVATFLSAATQAFPDAGRLSLPLKEKKLLQQLVKEHGYTSLGFIREPAVLPTVAEYNSLGFDLFRAVRARPENAAKLDTNVVFSPVSIATIMESLWMGSRGQTAAELAAALHLPKDTAIPDAGSDPAIAMLLPSGKNENSTILMANDLWIKRDWKPVEAFQQAIKNRLGMGTQAFDGANDAAELINAHVATLTNGKIQNLIAPGVLVNSTRCILTNVIYFKAPWEFKFDAAMSEPGDFLLSSGTVTKATYMKAEMEADYRDLEGTQVLSLSFAGGAQRLVMLLPAEGAANLEKLEARLNLEFFYDQFTALKKTKVKIRLPRFVLDSKVSLKDPLSDLNVKAPFDEASADFSGISEQEQLYITSFIHQATMEVNEEGAEATAASAAVAATRGFALAPISPEFNANRPFVVALLDNRSNTLLFLGRMAKPTSPAIP